MSTIISHGCIRSRTFRRHFPISVKNVARDSYILVDIDAVNHERQGLETLHSTSRMIYIKVCKVTVTDVQCFSSVECKVKS